MSRGNLSGFTDISPPCTHQIHTYHTDFRSQALLLKGNDIADFRSQALTAGHDVADFRSQALLKEGNNLSDFRSQARSLRESGPPSVLFCQQRFACDFCVPRRP